MSQDILHFRIGLLGCDPPAGGLERHRLGRWGGRRPGWPVDLVGREEDARACGARLISRGGWNKPACGVFGVALASPDVRDGPGATARSKRSLMPKTYIADLVSRRGRASRAAAAFGEGHGDARDQGEDFKTTASNAPPRNS
jgi:hypothetical protein